MADRGLFLLVCTLVQLAACPYACSDDPTGSIAGSVVANYGVPLNAAAVMVNPGGAVTYPGLPGATSERCGKKDGEPGVELWRVHEIINTGSDLP